MRTHGRHSSLRVIVVAACCAALAVTGRAYAEAPAGTRVAMLPAGVDRGVSNRLAEHAVRAMRDFLFDRGYTLTDARRASQLPAALRDCKEAGCMPRVHRALGADHVIAVELRRGDAGLALRAQWNDVAFVVYTSQVALAANTPDGAEDAGQEAMRALLEKQRRGPGPWLSIVGTPDGALVEIDGEVAGSLPFFGRVTPGRVRVVIRKEGYSAQVESVEVGDAADEYKRLRVALTPKRAVNLAELHPLQYAQLGAKAGSPKSIVELPAADERLRDDAAEANDDSPTVHPLDIVVGGALVLGGAALAIGPARTWARNGKCWNPPECTERVEFDGGQQAQLVGGAALAVTGLLWAFVLRPIAHASAPDHRAANAPEND